MDTLLFVWEFFLYYVQQLINMLLSYWVTSFIVYLAVLTVIALAVKKAFFSK